MKLKNILEKGSCYNDGHYYEQMLPKYTWNGKTDEEFLDQHLSEIIPTPLGSALELACGTGRGTKILSNYVKNITAVDKSKGMLSAVDKTTLSRIRIVNDDMVKFIQLEIDNNNLQKYEFIFSYWGIFYLVNQEFIKVTPENKLIEIEYNKAFEKAKDKVFNFLSNLGETARGCFIHVRRDTDEQNLNRTLWSNWVNERYNPSYETPSEIIFSQVFNELKDKGRLEFTITEVNGSVLYKNMEHAIETFLNFHSKGYFNDKSCIVDQIKYLTRHLSTFQDELGQIKMGAGFKLIDFNYKP